MLLSKSTHKRGIQQVIQLKKAINMKHLVILSNVSDIVGNSTSLNREELKNNESTDEGIVKT